MKNFKTTTMSAMMMAIMLFGTTFANAGIIMAGARDGGKTKTTSTKTAPCNGSNPDATYRGIIFAGFTGIIMAGFTGIIMAGAKNTTPQVSCGIIMAG